MRMCLVQSWWRFSARSCVFSNESSDEVVVGLSRYMFGGGTPLQPTLPMVTTFFSLIFIAFPGQ